jgi:hypothetical protein
MEPIIWMSLGAAGVVSLILMRLAARHGWAWVQAKLKTHAMDLESEFKQKVSGAVGDLDARIKAAATDVVHSELSKLESDIAALKAKAGI